MNQAPSKKNRSAIPSIADLFSLEGFPFPALFEGKAFAWEALDALPQFFEKKGKIESAIPSSVHLENSDQITIEKGCVIEPGAYIEGPCYLGGGCIVRHGAYVRKFVLAAPGALIGHCSEVKGSILFPGARASHFNYVGDSILGNGATLGAGASCSNVRLDKREVLLRFGEEKVSSNRRKLGAILGDGVQVGCGTILNPGTIVSPGVLLKGSLNLRGWIPSSL